MQGIKKTFLFFAFLPAGLLCFADQPSQAVLSYIARYKDIAEREMQQYKIPASITLAQGIIESGAGLSELAQESNNHFGIKCHEDWNGDKVYYDDDVKDECFRKYKTVEDSYEDHARFLSGNARYAFLFDLRMDDYKGWAKGLKQAGYATNPKYAELLIGVIETYQLYEYDKMTLADSGHGKKDNADKKDDKADTEHKDDLQTSGKKFYFNRIPTIIIREGDTPEKIAEENDIRVWRLYAYNDMEKGMPLEPGTKFYLQPKRKKGATKYHVVQDGETMWSVSRDEGVQLGKLYEYNLMHPGQEPAAGEKLWLRKKRKEMPRLFTEAKNAKQVPHGAEEKPELTKPSSPSPPETQKEIAQPATPPPPEQENQKIRSADSSRTEEYIEFEEMKPVPADTAGSVKAAAGSANKPAQEKQDATAGKMPAMYTVQQGDTLYGLAKKFGISVSDIGAWNHLDGNGIQIGQQLIVGFH